MSLFRYFGREKVKAVGDSNNLEAMKKDDDQSNATGVAKSTAELGEAQERRRTVNCKTLKTFELSFLASFCEKVFICEVPTSNCFSCYYTVMFVDFYNTNTNGQKQRDTVWSKHFIKILLNTVHCICISFSCSN